MPGRKLGYLLAAFFLMSLGVALAQEAGDDNPAEYSPTSLPRPAESFCRTKDFRHRLPWEPFHRCSSAEGTFR